MLSLVNIQYRIDDIIIAKQTVVHIVRTRVPFVLCAV